MYMEVPTCSNCHQVIHKDGCQCWGGREEYGAPKAHGDVVLEKIARTIWKAYKEGVKFSIQLTRARA